MSTSGEVKRVAAAGTGLKPKRSAEGTAVLRYAGSFDRRTELRNPDALAGLFLGPKFRTLARFTPLRRAALPLYMRLFPGAYSYQTARTKLFDSVLQERVGAGFARQLVILGAGYDTRPYRFATLLRDVATFEVDYPGTLERKLTLLRASRAGLTDAVTYVPADFNIDDWREKLRDSGFDDALPTLFLWEGVCMFIAETASEMTLDLVATMPPGSSIVFDYVVRGALTRPDRYFGGRQIAAYMRKGDEPWTFGVEHDEIEPWVRAHGLGLHTLHRPRDLERDFLGGSDGTRRVLEIHGVAHAGVTNEGEAS